MSETEFVVVDGVKYVKGTEPLSWAEKLKQMQAKNTEMPTEAIKTKKVKKAKKEEPEVKEVVEPDENAVSDVN